MAAPFPTFFPRFFAALRRAVFPSENDRLLRRYRPGVERVNALSDAIAALEPADFSAETEKLQEQAQAGTSLDELLPRAFALVREAATRTLGERHYDVQLMGGMALHEGRIAEMKTGEGKTLMSTLAIYLNALEGKGVHVVTPNDYLAKRDSSWMGQVFAYLGLSCGLIQHDMPDTERRAAYAKAITYGTNNEFGFDYLRDNMKFRRQDCVQRGFNFAIIDEVDSILIDEARTPLIISGPSEDSIDKYHRIQRNIHKLEREYRKEDLLRLSPEQMPPLEADLDQFEDRDVIIEGDYTLDEKGRNTTLTEQGSHTLEARLIQDKLLKEGVSLFDFEAMDVLHHVNQALKANYVFRRDVDYVVKDGKVLIVDEFTGRLMPGRRFGNGLHQALEAREHVQIERESQTYASITFQNYFRMYDKLGGMTGTAKTEEEEFRKIYNMRVAVIPTHRPMERHDEADLIYKNTAAKQRALVRDIAEIHASGQPILVGTISIEASEHLARALKKRGIPHEVLNAKYHEQEARIIAEAGQQDKVTIATNMAGRGTDIKLGAGVAELGGLFIIGTERHESRRIDNQLRGRSGRQGDPGHSRFYLSLEDDLLRIFGGERLGRLMNRLHVEDDEAITHGLISRAIRNAQKKVEAHHFEMRKHVLEYDDVMNRQREIFYARRRGILGEDVENALFDRVEDALESLMRKNLSAKHPTEEELQQLSEGFQALFSFSPAELDEIDHGEASHALLIEKLQAHYRQKKLDIRTVLQRQPLPLDSMPAAGSESANGSVADAADAPQTLSAGQATEMAEALLKDLARQILLGVHDGMWKEHLLEMDHLREGIGLVGYAQKKPIDEYKRAGFKHFSELMERISEEAVAKFFRTRFNAPAPPPVKAERSPELTYTHGAPGASQANSASVKSAPARRDSHKGRRLRQGRKAAKQARRTARQQL